MRSVIGLGLLGSLVSLGALLSAHHRFFDLLSHFRIQYIVLIGLVLCVSLFYKKHLVSLILSACLAVHGFDIYRSQKPIDIAGSYSGTTVRVMSSNVLATNTAYDKHIEYIKSLNPDVIVFLEYTHDWDRVLDKALSEYPHRLRVPAHHAFGIAMYSKLSIYEGSAPFLVHEDRKSVDATLEVDDKLLRIFGSHPMPPLSEKLYEVRNEHLQKLGETAHAYKDPMVVLGDLNITPWSDHFRQFVELGKLRDARRGQGLFTTWATNLLPIQIPIDHVLVNDHIRVSDMGTSELLGSDHKAIWADLQIRD